MVRVASGVYRRRRRIISDAWFNLDLPTSNQKSVRDAALLGGVATMQYPTPVTNIGTEMVSQEGILPTIHHSFRQISTECERRTMCSGVRNVNIILFFAKSIIVLHEAISTFS